MSLTDLSEELMMKSGAYQEGIDAYWDGAMYEQNPYKGHSIENQRWAIGWTTAEMNDYEDH